MVDIQTEHAYQMQSTIFQNKKHVLLGETGKEKLHRYCKNIDLGFKIPKEAISCLHRQDGKHKDNCYCIHIVIEKNIACIHDYHVNTDDYSIGLISYHQGSCFYIH